MKVSKNVSIDLGLLNQVLARERSFSRAVTEAVEIWLAEKIESDEFQNIHYRRTIDIMAPPDKIWPMLSLDRIPEWNGIVQSAKYTSKNSENVGTTGHIVAEVMGQESECDAECTEYVENERLSWRTTAGDFTAFTSVNLTPKGVGTEMRMNLYSNIGNTREKMIVKGEIEKGLDRGLEILKTIIEK